MYNYLPELVRRMDEPVQVWCRTILDEHEVLFQTAPGSGNNHHAWVGGYWDHVTEVMNLAVIWYEPLNDRRPLPFTLSSALLILFLHDLEKPWHYIAEPDGTLVKDPAITTKSERKAFRDRKLAEYGIVLTAEQQNAMQYVEGELEDYRRDDRAMGPLAAFCHACDNTSARLWHNYPLESGDPWCGAGRVAGSTSRQQMKKWV